MYEGKLLGVMKPLGGGDPIPLKKKELVIGRRPSCDIRLDFENISGRHCMLTFTNGTWHVRDLGSTNGTKVNGQKLQREQGLMPDDELSIASHLYHIDYEPAAPVVDSQQLLEEEEAMQTSDLRKATSLMELAGLSDEGRPRPKPKPEERPKVVRVYAEKPRSEPPPPAPDPGPSVKPPSPQDDDDFFKLIEDDVRPH